MAKVVGGIAGHGEAGVELQGFRDSRDAVIEHGVADDHRRPGRPFLGGVLGKPLEQPEGRDVQGEEGGTLATPEDIELENVGQLVLDQALELIERHIAVDADPVEDGLAHPEHSFRDIKHVGELEIREGGVEDERHRVGQLVLEGFTQFLVGALGEVGEGFEGLRLVGIKMDVEVLGRIRLPAERFVYDFVFAVVGIKPEFLGYGPGGEDQEQGEKGDGSGAKHHRELPYFNNRYLS